MTTCLSKQSKLTLHINNCVMTYIQFPKCETDGIMIEEKAQVGTSSEHVKIEELYQLEPGAGGEQKSVSSECAARCGVVTRCGWTLHTMHQLHTTTTTSCFCKNRQATDDDFKI